MPALNTLFTQLFHIQVKIKSVGYFYLVVRLELAETQKDLLCLWSYGIKGLAPPLPAWEPVNLCKPNSDRLELKA